MSDTLHVGIILMHLQQDIVEVDAYNCKMLHAEEKHQQIPKKYQPLYCFLVNTFILPLKEQ